MDRELVVEFARVTEAAAINCAHWIGRGRKNDADGAAVEAMRKMFDTVKISGTVVIGEGEMDEAPMLYIGEEVGMGYLALPHLVLEGAGDVLLGDHIGEAPRPPLAIECQIHALTSQWPSDSARGGCKK